MGIIDFKKEIGQKLYYANKKGNIRRGKVQRQENRKTGVHYVINGNSIHVDDQANTLEKLQKKLVTKVNAEHEAKLLEIENAIEIEIADEVVEETEEVTAE